MTRPPLVRYHLRAHLPPASLALDVEALRRIVQTGAIDEVTAFAPHEEEWSIGLGTDLENRAWVERFRPLFAAWRNAGLAVSVNVWWTQGFSDFPGDPRDLRDRFDFRWAVSDSGAVSTSIACPRDERWRNHVCRMYATFAELEPRLIWIDDDVRANLRANLRSPCFCEVCLAELGRKLGRTFSRQELVAAIIADPPGAVRAAWLESLDELIRTLDEGIAQAVHQVSPATRIGLMVSPVEGHAAEGRDWPRLLAAVGPQPCVRPTLGCYQGGVAPSIAFGLNAVRLTQAVCTPEVTLAPEVENYPQSRFFKPVRLVETQLQLCQLFGIPEVTFSVHRFGGRLDLDREDIWERSMGRLKPRLELLAGLGLGPTQERGIGLLFHGREGCHTRRRESVRAHALQVHRPWDTALPMLGFATRYGLDSVNLLTAETASCYSDAELRELCERGLLLDARAAEVMTERGLGGWIGVKACLGTVPAAMEVFNDAGFGRPSDLVNLRFEGAPTQFELLPGAREISWVRRLDCSRSGHGVVLWENPLGGRVAIYPFDSQYPGAIDSATFVNWPRQDQLHGVLGWLGRGPVPLWVPDAPAVYPLLAVQERRLVVTVANLSYDPVPELFLTLGTPGPLGQVQWLDPEGSWRGLAVCATELPGGAVSIRTGLRLDCLEVAVFQIARR